MKLPQINKNAPAEVQIGQLVQAVQQMADIITGLETKVANAEGRIETNRASINGVSSLLR